MRNIEKYKNNLQNGILICYLYREIYKIKNGEYPYDCCSDCDRCYDVCIRWLAEEFKEPVLDDVERKYLSEVIRPFRKKITHISKVIHYSFGRQYISIEIKDEDGFRDSLNLPDFENDTMYKGMEINKAYTLKELGL